jgi:hypothetical protein
MCFFPFQLDDYAVLLNRGGCPYVTKAENVEALGGKAVIVAQSMQGTYSSCSAPGTECAPDTAALEYDCNRGMAYIPIAAEPAWSDDNSVQECYSNSRWYLATPPLFVRECAQPLFQQ